MFEFFKRLFAADFMPHGMCYLWDPGVLWLNVVSDGVIAAAYYTIPVVLFAFLRKRRDMMFQWVFAAFAVFILACGTTHLMGIWTVWHPVYRLDGLIKAITGAASITTAVMIVPLLPRVAALPSPTQLTNINRTLEREIEERKSAEQRIRDLNRQLEDRVDQRTAELSQAVASLKTEIAERAKTEAALRASEARMRALLESASQGVIAVDEEGTICLVNARTEEMFGYSREELLGTKLEMLLPESRRSIHVMRRAGFFAHPRMRPMGIGLDLSGRRRDGNEFPIEISLSFVEEGRLALALISDITARKQFEEDLRQTQRLESVGVLAGGIAHDFNNLLTGVIGNLSLVIDDLPAESPNREDLSAAMIASKRAADLTRQLLAYAGRGQFFLEYIDLSALVEETTRLVRTSVPKGVEVVFDLAPDLPQVEADRSQIQQIAMNLIINAGEAIGERSGLITVSTRLNTPEENAAAGLEGDFVRLEVTDTGCGMEEDTTARIFDPFFTTKFTGRGLGLAAVQGIVRKHGGVVKVHSSPGRGSTFAVFLPAASTRRQTREEMQQGAPERAEGTVLVVDDEETVRRVASAALKRRGYTVLIAENGRQALDVIAKSSRQISLVILDLAMPVMGGQEAQRIISELRPELPIVISSGYDEEDAMRLFPGARIAGFLHKPYTAAEVAAEVARTLGGKARDA